MATPAAPFVAIEAPTGTTGSDGLTVFTFAADIEPGSAFAVDRLVQGVGIDLNVTGTRQVTFLAPNIPVTGSKIWLLQGGVSAAAGSSLATWDTVANLISDAAIELGLASSPIADPFASTDPNIQQLIYFLKRGGRRLARHRVWKYLSTEYTFSTVAGTAVYTLPNDFRGFLPDTGWNRSTKFPLGIIDAPEWQFRKAVSIAGTLYTLSRFQANQLSITPTPTAAQTVAFEYLTTSWVKPSGQTGPTSDAPAAATDVVCFDSALVVALLVAVWNAKKGFGQSDDGWQDPDFQRALYQAENDDSPAQTIVISKSLGYLRRVNRWNIPDTGVGQ